MTRTHPPVAAVTRFKRVRGPLYVAAGGGGDAIMAAVLSHARDPNERPVVATFAWDRLMYDPLPGPRTPADFDGLRRLTPLNFAIEPTTRTHPPAGSTLPRAAGEIDAIFVLLDPTGGAVGLGQQLAELIGYGSHERIEVVDVGGDILAEGHEPTLRSPLADSLALAATARQDIPVNVNVAGPGLDGELDEAAMNERLQATCAALIGRLSNGDAKLVSSTLAWHPSEATTLVLAAACGIRGRVEIRTEGQAIELTEASTVVYRATLADVLNTSTAASAVGDSTSFADAEARLRAAIGFTELDFERTKAAARANRVTTNNFDVASAVEHIQAYSAEAMGRGVDYLTFRRLSEIAKLTAEQAAAVRGALVAAEPERCRWGLWATAAEVSNRS